MANNNNLITNSERTPSERRTIASNGGKKSGEVRAKNKSIREALQAMLKGQLEVDGKKLSGYDAIAASVIKEALGGNVQAFKEIRDTIGEKPTDKVDVKGSMQFNSGGLKETLEELKKRD